MNQQTLRNLFLSLCFLSTTFQLFAKSTCTTPPTILVTGKAINQVQYAGGPQAFIRASDFNAGSYSNCGSLVAFSFSPNVMDTLRAFDCSMIGTNTVFIFLTDTEGNQSSAVTYVIIQDNLGLCNSPTSVSCPNEFILHNGLTTALSNTGTAVIHNTHFIRRIGENCTGDPVTKFDDTGQATKTLTLDNTGTNTETLLLEVNGTEENKVQTYIIVQGALSTTACIPVPILLDGINASLNSAGITTVFANTFDVASYSDCGGAIKISYSSNVNDTVRVYDATNFGTQPVEIWVTDLQTGTQNKAQVYILIQDLIAPICAALQDVQNSCANYQSGALGSSTDANGNGQFDASEFVGLSGALLEVYNNNFGTPFCADNTSEVAPLSIQQQYQLVESSCGISIIRRYRATDFFGNVSFWSDQNIQYSTTPDWQVTFPANVAILCGEEFPAAAISIETGSCNSLSYEISEEMVANPSAAPRLARTYTVFNNCLNLMGVDTVELENVPNGLTITSEGNEALAAFRYVQYLDIIDEDMPIVSITSPDPCISGLDFDAFPVFEEDITPGAAPYECDEIKTWSAQAVDCDFNIAFTGKISIDGNTILEVNAPSINFVVEPNVSYTVQFTATDSYGNVGVSTQQNTFFDCVRPMVQLRGGQTHPLPASGSLTIFATQFDHSSFDNCTDQSKLDFRIWHSSLGGATPDNLGDIQNLPTSLAFNGSNVGTNLVRVYVIDESGNWSYAETYFILTDVANCNTTPFDLPITIYNFSNLGGETKTWGAEANYATSPVSWTGKLFEDDILVSEVDTSYLTYTTTLAKDYKVVFTATDVCNNIGTDTLVQNFSDCNQVPFVRLVEGVALNIGTNGSVQLSAYQLDNGSFDNCTPSDKFAGAIWHASLGPFPQTIEEVNALSWIMTLDCNLIGTQVVHVFMIDEMGNYASESTLVIVQDNNGVCYFPPPPSDPCSETPLNLTGTISVDSTYQAEETITSTAKITATTDVTFQAGQSVTLNAGFHAVAGSIFTAKIEACSTAQTLTEVATTEGQQEKVAETTVAPLIISESIEKMELALNVYPNPFQGQTTVDYFIANTGETSLQLRDFLGRQVKMLASSGQKEKGWHQLQLNAGAIPAGTYYLVLMNNGQLKTRKLVILK